jgi:hypothetical protein
MFSQVDREFGNMLAKGLKKYVDTWEFYPESPSGWCIQTKLDKM